MEEDVEEDVARNVATQPHNVATQPTFNQTSKCCQALNTLPEPKHKTRAWNCKSHIRNTHTHTHNTHIHADTLDRASINQNVDKQTAVASAINYSHFVTFSQDFFYTQNLSREAKKNKKNERNAPISNRRWTTAHKVQGKRNLYSHTGKARGETATTLQNACLPSGFHNSQYLHQLAFFL